MQARPSAVHNDAAQSKVGMYGLSQHVNDNGETENQGAHGAAPCA